MENLSDDELPDEGLDLTIIPPENNNNDTDEDSSDKDCSKLHNLLPNQLLVEAVLIDPKSNEFELPLHATTFQSSTNTDPSINTDQILKQKKFAHFYAC